jgi:hypothetical protein
VPELVLCPRLVICKSMALTLRRRIYSFYNCVIIVLSPIGCYLKSLQSLNVSFLLKLFYDVIYFCYLFRKQP